MAAQGSLAHFAGGIGAELSQVAGSHGLLARFERRRIAFEAQGRVWDQAFFGPSPVPTAALVAAERGRRRAAVALYEPQTGLLGRRKRIPPLRLSVAGPEEVAQRQGARLEKGATPFPAPEAGPLVVSRAVMGPYGREYWIRFPSPLLGDQVTARVYEPPEAADPASLIFLHGVAMEPEFWPDRADPVGLLARRGLRVICPEGPWHGRRRLEGWYGGEPVLARGPLGFLELFEAWSAETARIIAWARQQSQAPVGLSGVSLGALSAQVTACAARDWPERLRPDALMLASTSGDMMDVAFQGSLARALNMPPQLAAAGWTEANLTRWLPLLEPKGAPALAPERIVMFLGETDDLTPYEGGLALARRWRLPAENLFTRRQGHFSAPLGLIGRPAPLRHFEAILKRA